MRVLVAMRRGATGGGGPRNSEFARLHSFDFWILIALWGLRVCTEL
jgi:hypothetical protein